jgi:Tol biopolymer transport system component
MSMIGLVSVALVGAGRAQVTQRVSVDSSGGQGNFESLFPSVSPNGRFVGFASAATNLVAGDTNACRDVFVRDVRSGTTERVSVASDGTQGNGDSGGPYVYSISLSADGRFVAFSSEASSLIPGDTNGFQDIFVRDRLLRTTERVSVASDGTQGNENSSDPCISADGRYVVFYGNATNLVPGDTNGVVDVFVRDRQAGTTERASVDSTGGQGNGGSRYASISADGRFVAFSSAASNLVPVDANGFQDIFIHDRQNGTTELVSLDSNGSQGNGDSFYFPSVSADGRFVAFGSDASNLVLGDTNGAYDIFVRDRLAGTTELVSVSSGHAQGDLRSDRPSISIDGRYVAFQSNATNLVQGDTNGSSDVFIHDRQGGTTERASVDTGGAQGDRGSGEPSVSADGRCLAFYSTATNLVAGDTNATGDIFVRNRDAANFTSLCEPNIGGTIACPCSNAPSGPVRGCDNSALTGGASLSATGVAYLSMDSLVFTTSGEKPTATSIVLQGTTVLPAGIVYGQGVRCVGGTLKRLFVKVAVAGSITAPDFAGGDPTVSTRSAAKGDVIQPGQSRWYLVYYRDPIVLGGCPASSTFNATQTGCVDWSL